MKKENVKDQYRVNEQIRAREVRVVGDDIESNVYPLAGEGNSFWSSNR